MAATPKPMSARGRLWFGLTFVAFGIMPLLATFDVGLLSSADINGPAWLGFAAGGAFILSGIAVIAGPGRPLLSAILVLLVMIGLAALGNWIAFGVGARVCSGSLLFLEDSGWSGMGCRIPFGIGAIITNAAIVLMLIMTIQQVLGGPPRMARQRKWAENLLLLSAAPILLPMAVILFAWVGFGIVKTRLKTGQWPRNESFIAEHKLKQAAKQRARAAKKAE